MGELQSGLTALAEQSLQDSLQLVCETLNLAEPAVGVIALGKMGIGAMAPMSDLDLVFVFDEDRSDLEMATRFVNRLQTAIATKMREGVVYELDTRLRPSGRSGAPTVSVDSLVTHHLERARTWEHIAFVFARAICADESLQNTVNQIKNDLINRPRASRQFKIDVMSMWQRIESHRVVSPQAAVFNSKLRVGGLMQTEYFCAAHILLNGAGSADHATFDQLMEASLPASSLDTIRAGLAHWRTLQIYERLLGLEGQAIDQFPRRYRAQLCEQLNLTSFEELAERSAFFADVVTTILMAPFAEATPPDDWQETAVEWC